MKKFLLFAAAALIAGAASAQLQRLPDAKKVSNRVVSKSEMKTMSAAKLDVSQAPSFTNLMAKDEMKKSQIATSKMNSLQAVHRLNALSKSRRAELQSKYTGKGKDYDTHAGLSWEMFSATLQDGSPVLVDVIPLPEPWASLEYIVVDYSVEGNTITIQPQKVVSGTTQDGTTYYYYLHSWTSEDGSIVLTLNEDGSLTTIEDEDIAYSAFTEDRFDLSKDAGIYAGYVLDVTKVKYYMEGQKVIPEAAYEPETLFLHPGPNVNGNYYSNLLMPVYTDINLMNGTDVVCDSYAWSVQQVKYNSATEDYDPVGDAITGNEENFSFYAVDGSYLPATLVATLEGESSEPFQWNPSSWIAGGTADSWDDGESPLVTFTKANPNGTDITAIKVDGCKSTIFYQGKPATPLYFTGVSLFVYDFKKNQRKELKLTCKIHKAHRDEEGHFSLGDLIAQADLTNDGVERGTWMSDGNLVKLNWPQFYVEDEFGMSEDVDFLQLDEEFAVVFEGWDNGSITSGRPLMFTSLNPNAVSGTYAIVPGEDTYTGYGWSTNAIAFVGFIDAAYGYLHTTDNTDLVMPVEGGQATIHVEPMFYSRDDDGNPTTALWLRDDSDDPDWVAINVENEVYTSEEYGFDLTFAADALPEGATGREAHLVFEQWGSKLEVNISQGEATGIDNNRVTITVNREKSTPAYNLAGQRVNSGYKGLVIKNGRKVVMK